MCCCCCCCCGRLWLDSLWLPLLLQRLLISLVRRKSNLLVFMSFSYLTGFGNLAATDNNHTYLLYTLNNRQLEKEVLLLYWIMLKCVIFLQLLLMDGSDCSLSSAQYSPASPSSMLLSCLVFLTNLRLFLALMLCITQLTRKSQPFWPCTMVWKMKKCFTIMQLVTGQIKFSEKSPKTWICPSSLK